MVGSGVGAASTGVEIATGAVAGAGAGTLSTSGAFEAARFTGTVTRIGTEQQCLGLMTQGEELLVRVRLQVMRGIAGAPRPAARAAGGARKAPNATRWRQRRMPPLQARPAVATGRTGTGAGRAAGTSTGGSGGAAAMIWTSAAGARAIRTGGQWAGSRSGRCGTGNVCAGASRASNRA